MSRASAAGVLTAAVMLGSGCGESTRLERVTLWEGDPECTTCQAQAITLWPNGPDGVTLRENSVYTAQLELDVPGDPDRCIYQFVSGSWELPSHLFRCHPEQPVIRRTFSTRRFSSSPAGDGLHIRVAVMSYSDRKQLELLLDGRRFPVTWRP